MIAIYTLDGTELQLAAGSGFTISVISTVFNSDDSFLGSFSYPVELAYTPANNKALGMAHRLENRSARVDRPVSVRILGQHWKRCTLSFTLGNKGYSAFLKIDNGAFGNLIKNKLLPEVFLTSDATGAQVPAFLQFTSSAAGTLDYMNQAAAEPGQHPVYFFPLRNRGLFGTLSGDEPAFDDSLQVVNPYIPGQGYQPALNENNNKKMFYTPFFSLTWVLQQVLGFLGYQGAGDFFTDPYIQDKVIYNTGFISQEEVFASAGLRIAPARHVPSLSIGDFFKKLRTTFKLAIYFDTDTGKAWFNYGKSILASRERVDLSGCISPEISIKSDLPNGYLLQQPVDTNDVLFKSYPYYPSATVGSTVAPQTVDNFIGTVFTAKINSTLLPGSTWRLPTASQTGNGYTSLAAQTDSYNDQGYNKNTYELRILTYRGLQGDSAGRLYPYGTSDELDSGGDGHTYGMSCWLAGDYGLLQRYNLDWYSFYLRTELAELTASLPFAVLQRLTPLGLLSFRTPDQVLMPALLSDITFDAGQNERLLQAKVRAYVVYSQQDLPLPAFSKFTPAAQLNPSQIFVRFNQYETGRIVSPKNSQVVLALFYRATLSFFSDEAATKPLAVSNVKVTLNYDYKGANPRNYDQHDFEVDCSGTVCDVPFDRNGQCYSYTSSKDFWSISYTMVTDDAVLAAGGYKVIV